MAGTFGLGNAPQTRGQRISEEARRKLGTKKYKKSALMGAVNNPNTNTTFTGLYLPRVARDIGDDTGENGMSEKKIKGMYADLMAPHKQGMSQRQTRKSNEKFANGMKTMKDYFYKKLKAMEAKYGKMGSQLHPEDFIAQSPDWENDKEILQNTEQLQQYDKGHYFDFENNEQDKEFRNLSKYYNELKFRLGIYKQSILGESGMGNMSVEDQEKTKGNVNKELVSNKALESEELSKYENMINGPGMNEKQMAKYKEKLKERAEKGGWKHRLFGQYQ